MKTITVTYEDEVSYLYDRELQDKGRAFEEMDIMLRSALKHDSDIHGLKVRKLKHTTYVELNDLRDWMHRILQEIKE
jgi:hypothetical protein